MARRRRKGRATFSVRDSISLPPSQTLQISGSGLSWNTSTASSNIMLSAKPSSLCCPFSARRQIDVQTMRPSAPCAVPHPAPPRFASVRPGCRSVPPHPQQRQRQRCIDQHASHAGVFLAQACVVNDLELRPPPPGPLLRRLQKLLGGPHHGSSLIQALISRSQAEQTSQPALCSTQALANPSTTVPFMARRIVRCRHRLSDRRRAPTHEPTATDIRRRHT